MGQVADIASGLALKGGSLVAKAVEFMRRVDIWQRKFTHSSLVWMFIIIMTFAMGPIAFSLKKFYSLAQMKILHTNTKGVRQCIISKDIKFKGLGSNSRKNYKGLPSIDQVDKRFNCISNESSNGSNTTKKLLIVDKQRSDERDGRDHDADTTSYPQKSNLLDYSFNMIRSLVAQGNRITDDHDPVRIVLVFWYIFCLVIYASYAGTLTAFMTIPAYEQPIDSLQDLKRAHKDGFVPAVQLGTSNEYFLRSAKSGIFKELWELTDPARSFPSNGREGIEKVLTDDIVYMSANLNSEIRTSQRGRHRFYLARQTFFAQGYGIACRIGVPYKQKFNQILTLISQAGLVDKWVKDEVRKIQKSSGPQQGIRVKTSQALPLSLEHLRAAFFLLLMGNFCAMIGFLFENRARKR